jgi:hypothetical protein
VLKNGFSDANTDVYYTVSSARNNAEGAKNVHRTGLQSVVLKKHHAAYHHTSSDTRITQLNHHNAGEREARCTRSDQNDV